MDFVYQHLTLCLQTEHFPMRPQHIHLLDYKQEPVASI